MDVARHPFEPAARVETPQRRLYQVLFGHKILVAIVFALLFGSVIAWAHITPHKYRSEAKLLVQIGRESVSLDPTAVIGDQTLDPRTTWENEINSELEIIRNAELRRSVVRALTVDTMLQRGSGPKKEPSLLARTADWARANLDWLMPKSGLELSDEDRAVLLLESNLHVRLAPESSVIKLGYDGPTPKLAQRIVTILTEQFLEKHQQVHQTPGSLEFFTEETERLVKELTTAENYLRDLKNQAGLSSVVEQRTSTMARLGRLEQEYVLAEANAESAQARVKALEAAMQSDDLPETVLIQETTALVSPTTAALQQSLDALRLQEMTALQNYEPDSRFVTSIREQIALAEKMLRENTEDGVTDRVEGPNPARTTLMTTLLTERANSSSMQAKRDVIKGQLEEMQTELELFNDLELEINRASRNIADLELRYQRQKSKLEQVRVDQELQDREISNINVLQSATLPLKSSRIGNKIAFLLALFLGVAGAFASAFVAEFLDQSVRTPEEVRKSLGLPVLVSLPVSIRWRFRTVSKDPDDELLVLADRIDPSDENENAVARVLGVTASRTGEGVSTVAANLASTLAQRSTRPVLLVDASVQYPVAHKAFKTGQTPGLSEWVNGGEVDGIRPTSHDNLQILPSGELPRASAFDSRHRAASGTFDLFCIRFEELVREWRSNYSHVVVDLPAVDELPFVGRVASHCDDVLMVVAAGKHRWQVLSHARNELGNLGAKLRGVILNKRRYPIPGWLYRTL